MKQTLTNNHISIKTKTRKRAVKTYIWSVLLYGCETWTVSKNLEKRLEAAEMWIWRRVLKIPWTARETNDAVLRRMDTKRELISTIRRRQLRFLGHVMRKGELENICLTGRVEGRRARGRQRRKYMDGISNTLGGGMSPARILQITANREEWQIMVANVFSDTALR